MADICVDNRFELIAEFKKQLIEATNIESSPDEMAVIDSILFREWQMGWLDRLISRQPRVMTLEEVNALDWDYCYLEQERLQGNEYRGMLGKYIMTCVTWPSITAAKILQGMDNYGKTWRCWTSRPDDTTREDAKWNDE